MKRFYHDHSRTSGQLCAAISLVYLAAAITVLQGQETPTNCESTETVLHYCNIDAPGIPPNGPDGAWPGFPGGTAKFGPDSSDEGKGGAAQRFTAGESTAITSITLGLARAGSPGGKLLLKIWDVDETTGHPDKELGIFGEIEIDSLSTRPSGNAPLELVTVNGNFEGLVPGQSYFLSVDNDDDAKVIGRNQGWAAETVEPPTEPASMHFFTGGRWQQPFLPTHLRARIEGPKTRNNPKPLNISIADAVVVTWDSEADRSYQIHRSSDMETWELAIDNIQGTGERMLQPFLREDTEVFYRVTLLE